MSPSTRRTPVTDMTGKLRRRRREAIQRRLVVGAVTLLVLALAATSVWLVGFSQVLASKTVRVTGTSLLTTDEVLAAAQVPMDVPLARIATDDVAGRVRVFPQVRQVDVVRAWPTTVEVRVTEREPVFLLATRSQGRHLVDAEGVPFLPVEKVPQGTDVAALTVAELGDDPAQRLMADVATVVKALTPALAGSKVTAKSRDTITLHLSDGRVVVMGSAADAGLKADVASRLLAATQASTYDVSAPSRPVTR